MLALVAAMEQELAAVLQACQPAGPVRVVAGRRFHRGRWHGHEVLAVQSGIGKVAAATTATILIQRLGASRIVLAGVAGGLGPGVQVGDVVVADSLLQHDMDASPLFPRHEVPLYGRSRFGADPALARGLEQAARQVLVRPAETLGAGVLQDLGLHQPALHRGLIISGDRFVTTATESEALRQRLPDALAVEMEGAAMAQVCHDHRVPFATFRTISDRADDTAHLDFGRFLERVASPYCAAILDAWLACRPATAPT